MDENAIFEVNHRQKLLKGVVTLSSLFVIIMSFVTYFLFLRNLIILQDTPVYSVLKFFTGIISEFSLLGMFFVGLFGGLFFVFFPMELYYLKALSVNNIPLCIAAFMAGMLFSYSADYFIGMNLSRFARGLISSKKFYGIKSYINQYGNAAILIVNGLPFFPSQQVTFILGVFRYNKTRLIILTLTGQLVKVLAIAGFYLWFIA
ncbi:MAG: hypothetical protein ACOCQX_02075 [Candidatus Nanoarchaeia archaeon]